VHKSVRIARRRRRRARSRDICADVGCSQRKTCSSPLRPSRDAVQHSSSTQITSTDVEKPFASRGLRRCQYRLEFRTRCKDNPASLCNWVDPATGECTTLTHAKVDERSRLHERRSTWRIWTTSNRRQFVPDFSMAMSSCEKRLARCAQLWKRQTMPGCVCRRRTFANCDPEVL
jgi:hypothetical protein